MMKKVKRIKMKVLLGIVIVIGSMVMYNSFKPVNFTAMSDSGTEISCERGSVKVPQVRGDESSSLMTVKYVKLKSRAENPEAPIFFLAGGPGNGAISQLDHSYYVDNWNKYLETRDVVLIDQRGVKKWWLYWINFKQLPENVFVDAESYQDYYESIAPRAMKAFKKRGVNLNAFTSIENAFDIEEIRKKLNYDKINILGFSYGTHLAQVYLKYFEENVENAIMAGVEGLDETFKFPMNMDKQFAVISEMVKQDSTLNTEIPDLELLYDRVASKLEKEPITLKVKTPIKTTREIKVGKYGLDYILRRDMGDLADIPVFPKLLYTIDNGDYGMLQWFVQKRYDELIAIPAMTASMDICSGGSQERLTEIYKQEKESRFGNITNAPFLGMLGIWEVKDLGAEFRKPVQSNVNALFLSGSLDLNTPPYQAERVKKGFPNSTHVIVENAGHEQILTERSMTKLILDFLDGKDVSGAKPSYGRVRFQPLQ